MWSNFLYVLPAQPVDATQALKRSAGVSNPSVLRGRPLSFRAIASRWSCECRDKSVPLGKYHRSSPFVFSFDPRCQGLQQETPSPSLGVDKGDEVELLRDTRVLAALVAV